MSPIYVYRETTQNRAAQKGGGGAGGGGRFQGQAGKIPCKFFFVAEVTCPYTNSADKTPEREHDAV